MCLELLKAPGKLKEAQEEIAELQAQNKRQVEIITNGKAENSRLLTANIDLQTRLNHEEQAENVLRTANAGLQTQLNTANGELANYKTRCEVATADLKAMSESLGAAVDALKDVNASILEPTPEQFKDHMAAGLAFIPFESRLGYELNSYIVDWSKAVVTLIPLPNYAQWAEANMPAGTITYPFTDDTYVTCSPEDMSKIIQHYYLRFAPYAKQVFDCENDTGLFIDYVAMVYGINAIGKVETEGYNEALKQMEAHAWAIHVAPAQGWGIEPQNGGMWDAAAPQTYPYGLKSVRKFTM